MKIKKKNENFELKSSIALNYIITYLKNKTKQKRSSCELCNSNIVGFCPIKNISQDITNPFGNKCKQSYAFTDYQYPSLFQFKINFHF